MWKTNIIARWARRPAAGGADIARRIRFRAVLLASGLAALGCAGRGGDDALAVMRGAASAAAAGDTVRMEAFTCTADIRAQIRGYAGTEPPLLGALAKARPRGGPGFTRGDTTFVGFRTRYGFGQEIFWAGFVRHRTGLKVCRLYLGDRFV